MALTPVAVCDVTAGTTLWLAGLSSRVLCTRALVFGHAAQHNTPHIFQITIKSRGKYGGTRLGSPVKT